MLQTFRRLAVLMLLLAGSLALAACGGSSIDSSMPSDGSFQETSAYPGKAVGGAAAASAQQIFAASEGTPTNQDDYRIAALDVLEVTVFGVPELNRTVQVSSSGQITLPLIKSVAARGKTTAQLERDIAAKLGANYLQSPQVSIFVKEFNSQKITVEGAVRKPGIFPITSNVSLLQAIALAEGLNDVADPSGVLLFRTVNNKRMAARFDLRGIRGGKMQDPLLKAGDIVMVDESARKTAIREVKDALPISGLFQLLLL